MANVTFDAVGPSSSGADNTGTSPLQWNHTCAAGAVLIVGVSIDQATGTAPTGVGASFNGASMTALGNANIGTSGYVYLYGLLAPASGTHQVNITATVTGTWDAFIAGSMSFLPAAGYAITGFGTFYSGTSGDDVVLSSTTVGNVAAGIFAAGSNITGTTSPANQEWLNNLKGSSGNDTGNATGAYQVVTATSTTMAWSTTATTYVAAAVEVQATQSLSVPTILDEYAFAYAPTIEVLSSDINPGYASTTVSFDWGTTTSYGNNAGSVIIPAMPDPGANPAQIPVTGLTANTTYHFRAVATNSQGTTYGPSATFTTESTFAPAFSGITGQGLLGAAPLGYEGAQTGGGSTTASAGIAGASAAAYGANIAQISAFPVNVAAATATAASPVCTIGPILPVANTAASAYGPTPQVGSFPVGIGSTSTSAYGPTPQVGTFVVGIGATSATAYAPTPQVTVTPQLAGASATAYQPFFLWPLSINASASAYAPTPQLTITPGLAGASASAYTPTSQLTFTPQIAGASAAAYAPTSQVNIPTEVGFVQGTQTNGIVAKPWTLTLDNVVDGDTLILSGNIGSSGTTISDNAVTPYTWTEYNISSVHKATWIGTGGSGGNVTVTVSGTGSDVGILDEINGAAATPVQSNTTTTSGGTSVVSSTVTPSGAGCMVYIGAALNGTPTVYPASPWVVNEVITNGSRAYQTGVVSGTGYSATWDLTASGGDSFAFVIAPVVPAFYAAASAGAYQPTVTTGSTTTASAGIAAASTTAYAPTVNVEPTGPVAGASAATYIPTTQFTVAPGIAAASAAAYQPFFLWPPVSNAAASALAPTIGVNPVSGVAGASAAAYQSTPEVGSFPVGFGAASAVAYSPVPQVIITPGIGAASAAAYNASVLAGNFAVPIVAAASATAYAPGFNVEPTGAVAPASATAYAPGLTVNPTAGSGASATAYTPTPQVTAFPVLAAASTTAYQPFFLWPPIAGASAAAYSPLSQLTITPGIGLASAAAYTASASVTFIPGIGAASAAAYTPTPQVTVFPTTGAASAAAYEPSVLTGFVAFAGLAPASAAAYGPVPAVSSFPVQVGPASAAAYGPVPQVGGFATGFGAASATAYTPLSQVTVFPGTSNASATAYEPSVQASGNTYASAGVAAASASAYAPVVNIEPAAGAGAASTTAYAPGIVIQPGAGLASAIASAWSSVTVVPQVAGASALAYNPTVSFAGTIVVPITASATGLGFNASVVALSHPAVPSSSFMTLGVMSGGGGVPGGAYDMAIIVPMDLSGSQPSSAFLTSGIGTQTTGSGGTANVADEEEEDADPSVAFGAFMTSGTH